MDQPSDSSIVLSIHHRPRLSPALLRELTAIEYQCYPPKTRYNRATITQFLSWPGSLLVCARKGSELAGFQISNIAIGQLITLDVAPQYQRQGIGSAILSRTLEEFRLQNVPAARCEIAVDNAPSILLHEKFGFQAVGIIPEYYENRADALVMVLPLTEPFPFSLPHPRSS